MGVRGWGPDTFPSDAMPTERHYQLFLHSPRALAVPNPTDDLPYGTAGVGGGGGRGLPWGPRPRGGGLKAVPAWEEGPPAACLHSQDPSSSPMNIRGSGSKAEGTRPLAHQAS